MMMMINKLRAGCGINDALIQFVPYGDEWFSTPSDVFDCDVADSGSDVQEVTYDEVGRRFVDGRQDVDAAGGERASLAGRLIATVEHVHVT